MLLILIVFGIIIILGLIRLYLIQKSTDFSAYIRCIPSYGQKHISDFPSFDHTFTSIANDLSICFNDKIISLFHIKNFKDYYYNYYTSAKTLAIKLKWFCISPPTSVLTFISEYEIIPQLIEKHNRYVKQNLLEQHKYFFDHCLAYPLTKQQREAIISEDENCLIVSSAGSGKTSCIVGKVKYLLEIKNINPSRILLISYTNKAATELTKRIGIDGLCGYTFHKLALDIIGKETGQKPAIYTNTDELIIKSYRELLSYPQFSKHILEYFQEHYISKRETRKEKRQHYLSEQKQVRIKALLPDMDGKPIYVRSEQERKICFELSLLGIKFRYEEPYEYNVADATHSQYCPDFSIYYEKNGIEQRIYLEHFGINEHGQVSSKLSYKNNTSYNEKNTLYNDGIKWKEAIHKKHKTTLIHTTSADFYHTNIHETIKKRLIDAGVPLQERSISDIYNIILPTGSRKEKVFIRLIATFITLLKSSCQPISNIIRLAAQNNDNRSEYIIKYIFKPVFEHYTESLRKTGKIDFTDTILLATKHCHSSVNIPYNYIIVDEFQDISVDRYNFLKALRNTNPNTQLFCVGDDWQSIYRFSGSDMALFNEFAKFFGPTEISKIETTFRFGEPLICLSAQFIQRNKTQIPKNIISHYNHQKTELIFQEYNPNNYCDLISNIVSTIPADKSILFLGRYSFDDYYLSFKFKHKKFDGKFYYIINDREIEFLTVHKSKGLEADYIILLQCDNDTYGFPSLINDDPSLQYVLTEYDQFPFGEERRLFYVAITRSKIKTWVFYNSSCPSVFVTEFLYPEKISSDSVLIKPNAYNRWTRETEQQLINLWGEKRNFREIANIMGRSQSAIRLRLKKLGYIK